MTSISLNITNEIDPGTLTILKLVADAAQQLSIPLFVIGATARDLVLHHVYGAKIIRATGDLDFAIQVPDWAAFETLKSALLELEFCETDSPYRLNTTTGGWIDLVPFGPISLDGQAIAWPPKGDIVMSILGFHEAFENAVQITINTAPLSEISVVSPVGLALLKLICWTEREREKRPNDAKDLLYLCANYQKIPDVEDKIYSQVAMMDKYGWEIELGSANLLGRDVRAIAAPNTHSHLERLFGDQIENRQLEELIRESCETDRHYEKHENRLNAFIEGYRNQ
jgi:predicted nucleotidyltransferase